MSDRSTPAFSNPFPGLRPFREDEEHLFFGREDQIDAMVDKLAATRFLAVVGTSGSGKSSLVNCGLRPSLHQGLMTQAGTAWRVAQFRPGGDPIGAMARSLAGEGVLFSERDEHGMSLPALVESTLRMSKLGVVDIVEQAQLDEAVNILVVVDQFEELFRYRSVGIAAAGREAGTTDAAAFVKLLLEAREHAASPIYVVLTMRSDFLGDCTQFPGLAEAINAGQYLVPRMTRDDRRAAVTGPIAVSGGEIEPVLLTRLVNDVGDNPDQLSILQHALNRTWARCHEAAMPGPLGLTHYRAVGEMEHALDQHAEQAWGELITNGQRQVCERLFKALTDKANDPRGVRRPTTLATLCALVDAEAADVAEVIEHFRHPSRSFLMPPAGEPLLAETVIDISHESLMRGWRRLDAWTGEEALSAQIFRRLAETARLHARGEAALWRDPDLRRALEWREAVVPNAVWADRYAEGFAEAMHFLDASREAREQEEQEREAERLAERDRREREELAIRERAEETRIAAQKAIAARRMRIAAGVSSVLATVALVLATFAMTARQDAEQARQEAEQARQVAVERHAQAEQARQRALVARSRMLASFARQQTAEGDATRGVLLALEALPTSLANPDRPYVPEAERALYAALDALREQVNFSGHADAVNKVVFSPDGSRVASASADGTSRIVGVASGEQLALLAGHQAPLTDVVFSPDGERVATASEDKTARIWDATTGELELELKGHGAALTTVAFSPDGTRLASASADASGRVWDARSGAEIALLKGKFPPGQEDNVSHQGTVADVVFRPDGERLATASEDGTARVWDATTGKLELVLKGHNAALTTVAFSPDGTQLATASADGTARIWDAEAGSPIHVLKGYGAGLAMVSYSADGSMLLSASADGTGRLWEASSGRQIALLDAHDGPVSKIALSNDGSIAATASRDGTVRLWELGDRLHSEVIAVLADHASLTSLAFSTAAFQIATGSGTGEVRVFDAAHRELVALEGHQSAVVAAAFSADGTLVVTGSKDASAAVWNATTGERLTTLYGHAAVIRQVGFNADGARVVTVSTDDTARVWNTSTGTVVSDISGRGLIPGRALVALAGCCRPARISVNSQNVETRQVVEMLLTDAGFVPNVSETVGGSTTLRLKDVSWPEALEVTLGTKGLDLRRRGTEVLVQPSEEMAARDSDGSEVIVGVVGAALSPDGERLLTLASDRVARLWNIDTGERLAVLRGHQGPLTGAAFSSDGRRVVTASGDGTARVWDTATGGILHILDGQEGAVLGVAFGAGEVIATATESGTVRVWDSATGGLESTLQIDQPKPRPAVAREDGAYVGERLSMNFEQIEVRGALQLLADFAGLNIVASDAVGGSISLQLKDVPWDEALDGILTNRGLAMRQRDNVLLVAPAAELEARRELELARLRSAAATIIHVAIGPDGARLATVSLDKTARLWDPDKKRVLIDIQAGAPGVSSARRPSEFVGERLSLNFTNIEVRATLQLFADFAGLNIVASDTVGGTVTLRLNNVPWDQALDVIMEIRGLAIRRMGGIVYIAPSEELAAREALSLLEDASLRDAVSAFSSDGARLLATDERGLVRLIDTTNGATLTTFGRLGSVVASVAFDADDARVVTGGEDGTARIWRVLPGGQALIDLARKQVPRNLSAQERAMFFVDE